MRRLERGYSQPSNSSCRQIRMRRYRVRCRDRWGNAGDDRRLHQSVENPLWDENHVEMDLRERRLYFLEGIGSGRSSC